MIGWMAQCVRWIAMPVEVKACWLYAYLGLADPAGDVKDERDRLRR